MTPKNDIFNSYLRLILGEVDFCLMDEEKKFNYKKQYEKFKLTINAITLMLSLFDLMFNYRVIDSLLHFLMVWYHCTLTIRESILVLNGSRIKGWWRAIQFIIAINSGILIVWPDGERYNMFRSQLLYYISYTSILQFLQFYYQHNCLYRLRALGERYSMDITIQGFHSWMWKGLSFLLPFLYLGYLFQLYNAITLFMIFRRPDCIEWQVPAVGLLYSVLFLGNVITTSLVIKQKVSGKLHHIIHRHEKEKAAAKEVEKTE